MNTYKLVAAAFALSLSTAAVAATAECCPDMACCKQGADCCDKSKGNESAHAEAGARHH